MSDAPISNIVGFGGVKGSGKDTASVLLANYLSETELMWVSEHKFAEPLYRMLATILDMEYNEVCSLSEEEKTEPLGVLGGNTVRDWMVHMGKETQLFCDKDVFAKSCITRCTTMDDFAIISDVRLPQEVNAIKAAQGISIYVSRPGCDRLEGVETESIDPRLFTAIVRNDCTRDSLLLSILQVLRWKDLID